MEKRVRDPWLGGIPRMFVTSVVLENVRRPYLSQRRYTTDPKEPGILRRTEMDKKVFTIYIFPAFTSTLDGNYYT